MLKFQPPEGRILELDTDLKSMTEIFFGKPPKFNAVLDTLRNWDALFNEGSR